MISLWLLEERKDDVFRSSFWEILMGCLRIGLRRKICVALPVFLMEFWRAERIPLDLDWLSPICILRL